ncbi:MAG: cytidine deaminase [Coprobacillus sp.]|nr:cytidine deaminase [Coprobacillus sp.]
MKEEELIKKAVEAMGLSYSPYSNFKVGAALETKDGSIYQGTNIENASYPLSMCAERNALYNAYCHGVTKEDIVCLCVAADTDEPVSPCGACRQVMSELLSESTPIILTSAKGDKKVTTIKELLPDSFKGEDMK